MKKALVGYGGHAREVMAQMGVKLTCFVDDAYVVEGTQPLSKFNPKKYALMVAVADAKDRFDIVKRLPDIGYEVVYQGGNGDYIDMVYSIDFIIKGNDKVYTVQSKTTQKQVDKFIKDSNWGKYKEVDLLIYPSNTKYKIFMVKDKVTKEIDK